MFPLDKDKSLLEEHVEAQKRKICNTIMRYYVPQKYSCSSLNSLANQFMKQTFPNTQRAS